MTRSRTTSHDIARAAGVSQPTVSRALRGDPRVAAATAARVHATAVRLGYVPDAAGRSLITGRAHSVAIVVADITNPFYPELVEALHRELGRSGYRGVLINERTDAGDAELERMLRGRVVDGAIVATATLDETSRELIAEQERPVVLLNRTVDDPPCDSVTSDNAGGAAAVARLLERLGHRRIGTIAGPPSTSTGRDRARGFADALRELGLATDPQLQLVAEYSHDSGHDRCLELLDAADPPTAIFCGNDVIALGALDAARARGVAVPDELSIVGFDDIPLARWESFRLTTVRQDLHDLATTAARTLLRRIEEAPGPARQVVFPTAVIERRTTAPPR
jgi:LacI family transcriptional regulator